MVSLNDPLITDDDDDNEARPKKGGKRPASARKRAANRKNAKRSTGPRSDEGKARSRLNATRHGLRGELPPDAMPEPAIVIFDGKEDVGLGDYAALRVAFANDLRPRGAAEAFFVERAARSAWRLRRSEAVEAHLFDRAELDRYGAFLKRQSKAERDGDDGEPYTDRDTDDKGAFRWDPLAEAEGRQFRRPASESELLRLSQYQGRLEGQFRSSIRELRHLRRDREKWAAPQEGDPPFDDGYDQAHLHAVVLRTLRAALRDADAEKAAGRAKEKAAKKESSSTPPAAPPPPAESGMSAERVAEIRERLFGPGYGTPPKPARSPRPVTATPVGETGSISAPVSPTPVAEKAPSPEPEPAEPTAPFVAGDQPEGTVVATPAPDDDDDDAPATAALPPANEPVAPDPSADATPTRTPGLATAAAVAAPTDGAPTNPPSRLTNEPTALPDASNPRPGNDLSPAPSAYAEPEPVHLRPVGWNRANSAWSREQLRLREQFEAARARNAEKRGG